MTDCTRRTFSRLAAGWGALVASPLAFAKEGDYPSRAVTCIVGFPAGGSVDFVARVICEKMSVRLGQPFVVENRPGAGGNLAAAVAAKAPPTGQTLFVVSSANALSPFLYKSLQYDPQKDFAYIGRWITTSYMVVVRADHPAKSLRELLDMARKDPGKITCGTQGVGTPPHMAEALMSMRANVRMLQVPFKGGPETMTGLLSGLIDFTFAPIPVALPQVRSGRLRLLAMTTAQRSSLYPDVATVAEQGLPGYEVNYWYGLAAPSGTPREVVNVISKCTDEVLAMPEVREKLQGQGMEPAPMGPAAFTEYFSKELKFYGQLIHDAKIEPI